MQQEVELPTELVVFVMAYKQQPNTGYYGTEGGIMPIFSCGSQPLAPSLLTGDGSHMAFWVAMVIHVAALALNLSANIVYMADTHVDGADLLFSWALFSIIAQALAVVGVLAYTGFVKNALSMPSVLTFLVGLYFAGIVATGKLSYAHSGMPADSAEVLLYNISLAIQSFGLASLVVSAIVAASKSGGL